MQQTLLAFLSMLILMSFALNQQRAVLLSQHAVYESEAQMVAVDYLQGTFEELEGRHYDERTKPFDPPTSATLADLTPAASLGLESGTAPDDLDDYDGYAGPVAHVLNGETFDFFVTMRVRYVDPEAPETELNTRAFGKKVTITVYEDEAARDAGPFLVRLSRVYTLQGMHFR